MQGTSGIGSGISIKHSGEALRSEAKRDRSPSPQPTKEDFSAAIGKLSDTIKSLKTTDAASFLHQTSIPESHAQNILAAYQAAFKSSPEAQKEGIPTTERNQIIASLQKMVHLMPEETNMHIKEKLQEGARNEVSLLAKNPSIDREKYNALKAPAFMAFTDWKTVMKDADPK